ncbi:ribosome-associated translation inhibitor RaiA [Christiangramia fulva]|uniref:Ribosome-associated translation inhibitor RaiA n=1 Tax=Christiangramia fulva TaxID=2126553 RepID=A0A2R3Z7T5_9FLAO|nr:ribosome-associated translation inhibitor RaiA [Christiangramia fulva]AVR46363.1 ribosome-associated translation inhibitor RaiA [Christiangramia fulva]
MEAIFEFVQLDKSENLESFTQKKLNKLENKYNWIVRANVFFKRDENQKPDGYICEIKLSVPGPEIFAQSNENSFEAAIAQTVSDLERQCSKRKAKMTSH